MSKKIKKSIKLEPGDAVVVAPKEDWSFVIDLCKFTMNNPDLSEQSRRGWKRVVDNMEFWVTQSEVEEVND